MSSIFFIFLLIFFKQFIRNVNIVLRSVERKQKKKKKKKKTKKKFIHKTLL